MAAKIQIGDQIGTYRVISVVDGTTCHAVHLSRAQHVLISVDSRDATAQMIRRSQMIDTLQHPGVARVVDRGVLADHRPWLATEIVNGLALYDVVSTRALNEVELVDLIRYVAEVLAYAHRQGVVHRALKLRSVVLLTGERTYPVSISDWGAIAPPGLFSAPEGERDGRSDVYALGVIAYRAATQRFPRGASNDASSTSPGLSTLIMRMLAGDPDHRPTAAEVSALATELRANVDGDAVATAIATAELAAVEPPDLIPFADDDHVHITPARFGTPRWTPAPDFSSSSQRNDEATDEIVAKRPASDH
ncbi:MAG: hypothetical protein JWO36_5052 [Myxococcales bacterium]|nr:hypothetical protein [Myxococcales bacterium]